MSRKHKEEKVEIKDNAEELPAEEEAKEECKRKPTHPHSHHW